MVCSRCGARTSGVAMRISLDTLATHTSGTPCPACRPTMSSSRDHALKAALLGTTAVSSAPPPLPLLPKLRGCSS